MSNKRQKKSKMNKTKDFFGEKKCIDSKVSTFFLTNDILRGGGDTLFSILLLFILFYL